MESAVLPDEIDHLDFEPLTAVYVAPTMCGKTGAACLYDSNCCSGFVCEGADVYKFEFGICWQLPQVEPGGGAPEPTRSLRADRDSACS